MDSSFPPCPYQLVCPPNNRVRLNHKNCIMHCRVCNTHSKRNHPDTRCLGEHCGCHSMDISKFIKE